MGIETYVSCGSCAHGPLLFSQIFTNFCLHKMIVRLGCSDLVDQIPNVDFLPNSHGGDKIWILTDNQSFESEICLHKLDNRIYSGNLKIKKDMSNTMFLSVTAIFCLVQY